MPGTYQAFNHPRTASAHSRGILYDNQKMSRLMDVVGDGKDVVRMCIDATRFSNLGRCVHLGPSTLTWIYNEVATAARANRFLNHSCDPNCFKQRILCDQNSCLPRIGAHLF